MATQYASKLPMSPEKITEGLKNMGIQMKMKHSSPKYTLQTESNYKMKVYNDTNVPHGASKI